MINQLLILRESGIKNEAKQNLSILKELDATRDQNSNLILKELFMMISLDLKDFIPKIAPKVVLRVP
jgi:hypothetical protein